ncbi:MULTISPECIES: hypothetical protein [Pseudonocardia]|uniref:Uncharacterized protein n=2 Tax=Pseudonocardia TaxID=1847 RepID=A0A1Y2N0L0_PSEAH|nr:MULTISPECIES: hypothetical protein [Pseudonocardia]OSY41023.1 hypothetical protein BG845_02365 [Pseudonocardia autotrophica]TDN73850.1 hypothetical protein C8E95_2957 [Pseudonocardia autotrophica]BBG04599.1 hypothetical protein Pdca_58080 [Pseudonocardia autotrophica]GEC25699.1 hypothetical protein PSA01_27280 [Pseudonocardia saturnea]
MTKHNPRVLDALDRLGVERERAADQRRRTTDRQTLDGVPARLAEARETYLAALRKAYDVAADVEEVGAEAVRRAFTTAEGGARQALDAARADVERIVTAEREQQAAATDRRGTDERLLAELQESRAWSRVTAQLDGGRTLDEVLADAREAGDAATLRAIRAELPAHARAVLGTSDGVSAGVPDPRYLGETLGQVDDALVAVLPAAEAKPIRDRQALDAAEAAATRATESFSRDLGRFRVEPSQAAAGADAPTVLRREWSTTEIGGKARVRSFGEDGALVDSAAEAGPDTAA